MTDDPMRWWASRGAPESDASNAAPPAFLETEPSSWKPIEECTRDEVTATSNARLLEVKAMMDELHALDAYVRARFGDEE